MKKCLSDFESYIPIDLSQSYREYVFIFQNVSIQFESNLLSI